MKYEPKIPKRFCTTREAAEILGISLKTAQLWSESGLLTAWRTAGGHRRIVRESIERLLAARPESPSARATDLRLQVLVAESDPLQRGIYAAQIARWPVPTEVTLTADAVEALLSIGRRIPDLLIADLDNAELDALHMLRRLRRLPELGAMAIVAVTALSDAELADRGGLPGDVSLFGKPIAFAALERAATAIVVSRRQAPVVTVAA